MRKAYQTDLSDAEWSCLESYLPAPKDNERPRIYPLREILEAIFYIVRSGCAWRLLPHEGQAWRLSISAALERLSRIHASWRASSASLVEPSIR